MKTFLASLLLLAFASSAFAAADTASRTIEVRPPNGQPITITFAAPATESPYALTGNHPQPSDTLNTYQNVGHN